MKTIFFLFLVFFTCNSQAQPVDYKTYAATAASATDTLPRIIEYKIETVKTTYTNVIRIDTSGNFFYWPSTFCDCDKCKVNGWKFLYKIKK